MLADGALAQPAAKAQSTVPKPQPTPPVPRFKRSLASFAKSNPDQPCFDRKTEPYTGIVDSHFHPRPFGGQAIEPTVLFQFFDKSGVRFVNYFGIGQSLDMKSDCTYYLDCPGTSALPSINGQEVKAYPHPNVHIVLSMTFIDPGRRRGDDRVLRQRVSGHVQLGRRGQRHETGVAQQPV